jgi:hypothetical protein
VQRMGAAGLGAHEEAAGRLVSASGQRMHPVRLPLGQSGTAEVLGSGVLLLRPLVHAHTRAKHASLHGCARLLRRHVNTRTRQEHLRFEYSTAHGKSTPRGVS